MGNPIHRKYQNIVTVSLCTVAHYARHKQNDNTVKPLYNGDPF